MLKKNNALTVRPSLFPSSDVKNQHVYIYNCEKANEILTKNPKIFTWKQLYHAKFRNEYSSFFLVGLNNVLSSLACIRL